MTPIALPFPGILPLVLFLAKATLLLCAAFAGTMWLRNSTAGARHLVWLAALVGVLALPLLSRIPALRVGLLPDMLASSPDAIMTPPPAEAAVVIAAAPPAPGVSSGVSRGVAPASAPVI